MEADTVEYGEWKTGLRTEGTTYSVFSFTRKMGQTFGGGASAFTIGLGGYVAGPAIGGSDRSSLSTIAVAFPASRNLRRICKERTIFP